MFKRTWKKILIVVMAVAFLTTAVFAGSEYPFRWPTDPKVSKLLTALETEGGTILGVVDDKYGNYLLWVQYEDNPCLAYLLGVGPPKEVYILSSCEEALNRYKNAVKKGEIINPPKTSQMARILFN